jgi:hypothetical protein
MINGSLTLQHALFGNQDENRKVTKEDELKDRIARLFSCKKDATPAKQKGINAKIISCRKELTALKKVRNAAVQSRAARQLSKSNRSVQNDQPRSLSPSNNNAGMFLKWGSAR